MQINNIDNYIKSNKIAPVILIFGEEEFLVEEALDKLTDFLVNDDNSFDFDSFDADSVTLEKIIDVALSFPFVAENRIVIVRNIQKLFSGKSSKKNDEKSPFYKYLSSPQTSTKLILTGNIDSLSGIAKAKSEDGVKKIISSAKFPFNLIAEKYDFIEFPKLYESNFSSWITQRLKAHNKTIEPDAMQILLNHTNPTLRDLDNEISKLLLYIGQRKDITTDDITFVTGTSRNFNVFELQKAVGKKETGKAINIAENMLQNDRVEMLIISNLTKYFLTLFKLCEEAGKVQDSKILAKNVGVHPFFIKEYLQSLKLYKVNEIEKAFVFLNEADEILKSSSINSVFVLQKMLINITGSQH